MAVVESQVPLPAPPTGVSIVLTEHVYNPENGHYEPPIRGPPLNVNLLSPLAAAAFLAVAANTAVWFYHFVFANTGGAAVTVTLAEPGGNTYIVEVPANTTVQMISNPNAPLFVSRVVGNITLLGTIATVQVTATYVVK
ncbi:MAG: hypothetical protein V3U97_05355 [bacterium]